MSTINSCLRSTNFSRIFAVHVRTAYITFFWVYINFCVWHSAAAVVPHGTIFAQADLPPAECVLVLDAGFSFTHVVPIINGQIVWNAVKR